MPRPALGKVRFMNSMSPELLKWVDDTAKARRMTRADLIEEGMSAYRQREERKTKGKP